MEISFSLILAHRSEITIGGTFVHRYFCSMELSFLELLLPVTISQSNMELFSQHKM